MKIENKVAIVTGASKGIGKAIATRFAREGASLVVASRSRDALEKVAHEIKSAGGEALVVTVDVRNADSTDELVKKTVSHYGRLDLLVNNAGITMGGASEELSPEDWRTAMETDLFGVFFACQAAARVMIPQGSGNIINISSVNGILAAPRRAAYCSSKAGVNALTKVLAIEWADRNIRVNAIAPGWFRTDMMAYVEKPEFKKQCETILDGIPARRFGDIDDMKAVAVFLASSASAYITGHVLINDGGMLAK